MPLQVDSRTNLIHRSVSTSVLALRLEAGAHARLFERDQAIGSAAVALAEDQLLRGGVTQVPGLVDHDHDVGGAAGDVIGADVLRHHVHRLDAVLQRDDDGVGTDQRRERGRRRHRRRTASR